jgi:hypothetical protein
MALLCAAWDGGHEVRVRRIGGGSPSDDSVCDDIPHVSAADLDWADVTVIVCPGPKSHGRESTASAE